MKLNVPYYSQFLDIDDSFWMLRACGAASLKMVTEYEGAHVSDLVTLCNEAKESGGYDMDNGWIHDYLVNKAKSFGLTAWRKEGLTDISEIIKHLDAGHPVIVSVEKRVLEQKRFHMLVLTGYDSDAEGRGTDAEEYRNNATESVLPIRYFFYHEPESTNRDRGQHRKVDVETFLEYWRGKAIFVQK